MPERAWHRRVQVLSGFFCAWRVRFTQQYLFVHHGLRWNHGLRSLVCAQCALFASPVVLLPTSKNSVTSLDTLLAVVAQEPEGVS
jgi:hypothetical protein